MKPALFFDFDDTLVETREASKKYILHRYGVEMPKELYLCGNSLWVLVNSLLPPERRVEKDQFYQDWRDNFLTSDEHHRAVQPVREADVIVPQLSVRYDLWVVTARQEASQFVVARLCRRIFGRHITGMHFVWRGNDEVNSWEERSKKDFITNFAGEKVAFFDDNPGEVRAVQPLISAYLFDPLGFHREVTDIERRVSNWHEIADLLL
jgi:hypothetical protein